jgi:hypothetical protein
LQELRKYLIIDIDNDDNASSNNRNKKGIMMSQFVISDADKELLTVFGLYAYFEEYIKVLGIYEKRSTLDRVVTTLTQA